MPTHQQSNTTECSRCSESVALDEGKITLHGETYHRGCGLVEAAVKGFHHIRGSHKWQVGVCLGVHDTPLHPPPSRACREAGLIHCARDDAHISASTFAALKYWYESRDVSSVRSRRTCAGWDIDRTMRRLIGMFEATTLGFDRFSHYISAEDGRPSILIPGESLEVAQNAALSCNLALKTLYAIHHPEARKGVFRKMNHDISKAWDKMVGEQGILIGIMRAMPVFPVEDINANEIRSMLRVCADFDELRWAEGQSDFDKAVSPLTHLGLAWATYLRCDELVEYDPISPQLHKHIRTHAARQVPQSVGPMRLTRVESKQPSNAKRQHRSMDEGPQVTPSWLRLAREVEGLDRKDDLVKSYFGLLHRSGGAYVYGSTYFVLQRWALHECTSETEARRFKLDSYDTTLGDALHFAVTLPGRLESITGHYAISAHITMSDTIDGQPAALYFGGELILYAQSAVFALEQTLKWLHSLTNPEASLSVYKRGMGHDVLRAWEHISDHHDNILEIFHAMPLFQSDHELHEREHVSGQLMLELLGRFSTTYFDARYGIADPSKKNTEIQVDYRINLHLAWAVYLYGLMNLPVPSDLTDAHQILGERTRSP